MSTLSIAPMSQTSTWPADALFVLSALEAAGETHEERRRLGRAFYQVAAELKLYTDGPDHKPWRLYTRDVNPRGVGFITPHRLPLGYGGVIRLCAPNGQLYGIPGTLLRCREAAPGWYDAAMVFNRHQWIFDMQ